MFSVLVFLFILGILIIVHEFGHFMIAKKMGVRVEVFSFGFGPKIFSTKKQDTEYQVSLVPLGGYVKFAGDNLEEYKGNPDEYMAKPLSQRAAIIFFGPLLNYILGFLFFWFIFFIGFPTLTTKVGTVLDGLGAKEAGIQPGDRIVALDNNQVEFWEDLQNIILAKKEASEVKVSVLRQDKEYAFLVKLREREVQDAIGQKIKVGLLGITPEGETAKVRYGVWRSFSLSAKKTWDLTRFTYQAIGKMLTGKLSMRESVTGPVGLFYITSKAAKIGLIAVLHLIAVLSISLAIFNLLPLPILDGGHLVLLGIEKIRGRNLSPKAEQIITRIGLTVIISLLIFATYNDILRFFIK